MANLAAVFLAGGLSAAAQLPITNGGFELPILPTNSLLAYPIADTNVPGWTIGGSGGPLVIVNGQPFNWILPALEQRQYLVFNSGDQSPGTTISQSFPTLVGRHYWVRFTVGRVLGNGDLQSMGITATATASDGAILGSHTVTLRPHGWGPEQRFHFRATTPLSTLTFQDISAETFQTDVALDNVSVELIPLLTIVSNSATLSVTFSGSNIHLRADFDNTNGAFTLVQGLRPDALQLPPHAHQITNQIVDLGWVPASRTAQWTLPNSPASRFFRLELEPVLRRGRALVFKNGWIDFEATRALYGEMTNATGPVVLKQPEEVWLDHLGTYDTNGVLIGSNEGLLTGFYGTALITSIGQIYPPLASVPNVPGLTSLSNDFRIDFTGMANGLPRESLLWASQVQFYWCIDDYRTRFLNQQFVNELNLPPSLASNLLHHNFRPDLDMTNSIHGIGVSLSRPKFFSREWSVSEPFRFSPLENAYAVSLRSRHPAAEAQGAGDTGDIPLSLVNDSEGVVADYAGLVMFWVMGSNKGLPGDAFWGGSGGWFNNVLPPINDGISAWVAYRYNGNPEIYRGNYLGYRRWAQRPCGGTNAPCDRGQSLRNVLMHDEAVNNGDGVFPFIFYPAGVGQHDGPLGSDWAALYFAAIFYDIAHEAGMGVHKADLLFWKTLSLITDTNSFNIYTMRMFGSNVMDATRALWPDGRYTNDVADVLTSRGITLFGATNFRSNLPPVVGKYSEIPFAAGLTPFASAHPSAQSSSGFYGSHTIAVYRYEETNAADYVAYQFYKHSKLGPCDRLAFTDGTFTTTNVSPFSWSYSNDGTYYAELVGREMGNIVVLLPGRTNRWMNSRQRCPDEATGYYVEDQRPFGFRVIQATPNGFSFTTAALGETPTDKTYALTIVDPSLNTLGPAAYAWTVTNHLGAATSQTGRSAQFTVAKDEPFTLHIARTRGTNTATLTLRERGNDFDRNGGRAFVRNLVQ